MNGRHVAFLRGIGPAKKAPGDELRRCLAAAGFIDIVPVLSTGNVMFSAPGRRRKPEDIAIEAIPEAHFGYPISVVLRGADEIEAMIARDPFRHVDPAKETRFVCMMRRFGPRRGTVGDPPKDAGLRIIERSGNDLFLALRIGETGAAAMRFVERQFEQPLTTRNWSTMEKIAERLQEFGA